MVWKLLTQDEEAECILKRECSLFKAVMTLDERVKLEGKVIYAHHADDQKDQNKNVQIHQLTRPGIKPTYENWKHEFKHIYIE